MKGNQLFTLKKQISLENTNKIHWAPNTNMADNMLYESAWEHFYSLLIDLLIFFIKSIYYIGESIFLTLVPSKLRKIKVSRFCVPNIHIYTISVVGLYLCMCLCLYHKKEISYEHAKCQCGVKRNVKVVLTSFLCFITVVAYKIWSFLLFFVNTGMAGINWWCITLRNINIGVE